VAVVRISGPLAHDALAELAGKLPPPRVARLARLHWHGDLLDSAIVLRFDGPASETGEDVTELQLHGGRSVVAGVTAALARMPGLRLAEPGEFTRRAFMNGRIDLAQAEGLADLIEAETQSQKRSALALAGGGLSRRIADWEGRLLAIAAAIEAELDFADEDEIARADIGGPLKQLRDEIARGLAAPPAERLRDGIRVSVSGPPNAGKSMLFNALIERDAAIVSPVAGTTRDVIEAPVALRGVPFIVADTAGLRTRTGRIEALGTARARDQLAAADLVLWLGDPAAAPPRPNVIRVAAKIDVKPPSEGADMAVSALTGQGMEQLKDHLVVRARSLLPPEGEAAFNARHRQLLRKVLAAVEEAAAASETLLAAEALRRARAALDRVTGRAGVEDMLDSLFGRFCIGK
jgi:tRNA modification GTPase